MLPLSLLKTAQGHPMLVELKNGETYNGHLVNCDTWMNIHLREVICTSKVGVFILMNLKCENWTEIGFGECLSATFGVIRSSILEFRMRLLIRFKKRPRVVQIGNPLEWGAAEEEEEEMIKDVGGVVAGLVVGPEVEAVHANSRAAAFTRHTTIITMDFELLFECSITLIIFYHHAPVVCFFPSFFLLLLLFHLICFYIAGEIMRKRIYVQKRRKPIQECHIFLFIKNNSY